MFLSLKEVLVFSTLYNVKHVYTSCLEKESVYILYLTLFHVDLLTRLLVEMLTCIQVFKFSCCSGFKVSRFQGFMLSRFQDFKISCCHGCNTS